MQFSCRRSAPLCFFLRVVQSGPLRLQSSHFADTPTPHPLWVRLRQARNRGQVKYFGPCPPWPPCDVFSSMSSHGSGKAKPWQQCDPGAQISNTRLRCLRRPHASTGVALLPDWPRFGRNPVRRPIRGRNEQIQYTYSMLV
jgi:hypothetical protein